MDVNNILKSGSEEASKLVLELVARHGNLDQPSLRTLTLVCKHSNRIASYLISKTKRQDEFCNYYISRNGEKKYHGMYFLEHIDESGGRGNPGYLLEKFVDGLRNGASTQYNADSTVREKCFYRLGKKHGTEKTWCEDGSLYKQCTYKDGIKHGKDLVWYGNGKLFTECTYKNGRMTECKKWYPNGKIKMLDQDGKDKIEWNERGEVVNPKKNEYFESECFVRREDVFRVRPDGCCFQHNARLFTS